MNARQLKTIASRGSEKGFSLVELMIVVAIIGILATIAIPNFNRFQVKARQSEAKSLLGGLYIAEKSFFAEWNSYYGDFRDVGFTPEGRMRYAVGFAAVGAAIPAPFVPSTVGGAASTAFNSTIAWAVAAGATVASAYAASTVAVAGCGAAGANTTNAAFVATANATAAALGSANADKWTISEGNLICNNEPGI